ncbi:hybrid sensor histidine kinase/response regulator transcription factor [Spirosoma linguale]|uniref:histidine kinase n=1 Tax=Spirosoma linguale (strain ATCC 33905 / DSM 74 / LMG 10896 / Claus 1) TaxID=504472 RepID=D2QBS1_SPILD|nr:response regulator receiver sensor hybrid histidine kinase [Spirosoma linguale DSM 74]
MTTILVVDDEEDIQPVFLGKFRSKIQQGVYQFRFATNGRAAIEKIRQESDIDLVLLDINMPELDGLSVLAQLPSINPFLGTVIISAYDDMSNIRQAMNRGAFDFICKPIDFADMELTIEKTVHHIRQLRETDHLKLIDALKTRFFDNITHELRTPLTLILSPIQQLIQRYPAPPDLSNGLRNVERHGQQLLQLINQLLDLAKMESGHLTLMQTDGNLSDFVRQIVRAFEPLAQQKGLALSYESQLVSLYAFDTGKLERIVHNLLSNALKFTQQGNINVRVTHHDTGVQLVVADTGMGIVPEKLTYIFNRFYQVEPNNPAHKSEYISNPGTGIGLSLVKELAELMGGRVEVQSVPYGMDQPSGTTFTVNLPLYPTSSDTDGTTSLEPGLPITTPYNISVPVLSQTVSDKGKPLVLVVEDNQELCAFISGELAESCRIMTANDGIEGWEIARNELPDVVLTDIMMSGLDGFELTRRLKANAETDHIAVLMLTAKTAQSSRMEGLQTGADDYIAKPFHLDELKLKLNNLLDRQLKLREHYHDELILSENMVAAESVKDSFVHALNNLIEARLDDSTFGVDELAKEVGMSRRTLHRKLTALVNMPVAVFIRQYRLKRAVQFMRLGNNVSQAAYMVGYESPAHFSTVFKEFFGRTPTDYLSNPNPTRAILNTR